MSPSTADVPGQADTCVIVPTIREPGWLEAYAANAVAHGHEDRLWFCLVTEEFAEVEAMRSLLADLEIRGRVFDGSDRAAWLADRGVEDFGHLIPRKSHAQTSFGLLYLWDNPAFEFGLFLDDDTIPSQGDFFGDHFSNLDHQGPITSVSSSERWVNVLYQNVERHGLYPRGYPYDAMGASIEETTDRLEQGSVVASQGLWTDVPDLDAVRILMDGDLQGQAQTRTTEQDYTDQFVVAPDHYTTVCSMNLAFRRRIVPAFYQLPMGDNEWGVGRFDDIWSGVLLKRAADLLGDRLLTGRPLCRHDKAPRSTFDDLAEEVPALQLNEVFWEIIDDAGSDARTYAEAYESMAETLADGEFGHLQNGAFLNHVGETMADWLDCLDELSGRSNVARAAHPQDV